MEKRKRKKEGTKDQERRGLPKRSHIQEPTEPLFITKTGTQQHIISRQLCMCTVYT